MHDLLIRNAVIALPDGKLLEGDLACAQGRITAIASHVTGDGREEIDAEGKLLIPGVIDPQVHFREPGGTDKEDAPPVGTAAAFGLLAESAPFRSAVMDALRAWPKQTKWCQLDNQTLRTI